MPSILDSFEQKVQQRRRARQRSAAPPLTTLEEATLMDRLKGGSLSTLETVGRTLDIPGGFVRNRLADLTGAAIPTDENISGRQLLENWGIAGPNVDQGWIPDPGDVGGFALEVLTDPLTYLTLGAGAATKTGKALKAAARYPRKTLVDPITKAVRLGKRSARRMAPQQIMESSVTGGIERAAFRKDFLRAAQGRGHSLGEARRMFRNEPIAGSFGFFGKTIPHFGKGKVGSALDRAEAAVRYSTLGRTLYGAPFDPTTKSLTSIAGQAEVGPAAFAADKANKAAAIKEGLRLTKIAKEAGFSFDTKENFEFFRKEMKLRQEDFPSLKNLTPEQDTALNEITNSLRKEFEVGKQRAIRNGSPAPELIDEVIDSSYTIGDDGLVLTKQLPYAPRLASQKFLTPAQQALGVGKILPTFDPHTIQRQHKGFERGTEGIHEAMADGRLTKESTLPLETRTGILGKDHMGWSDAEDLEMERLLELAETPDAMDVLDEGRLLKLQEKWGNIKGQAQYIHTFAEGSVLFGRNPIADGMARLWAYDQVNTSVTAVHRLAGITARMGGEGQVLSKVLGDANITGEQALSAAARHIAHLGDDTSKEALRDILSKRGINIDMSNLDAVERGMNSARDAARKLDDELAAGLRLEKAGQRPQFLKALHDEMDNFRIPDNIAADAKRIKELWTSPKAVGEFLKGWDAVTNAWRAGVTTTFPAFHMRNALSEFWNNWIADGYDPRYGRNPVGFVAPYKDSIGLLAGKELKDLTSIPEFKGMTNKQATRAIGEEGTALELSGFGQFKEIIGEAPEDITPGGGLPAVPGDVEQTLRSSIAGGFKAGAITPKAVRSIRQAARGGGFALGKDAPEWIPVAVGRGFGKHVEDVSRWATYIAKRRQGHSPEAAAQASKFAHVDYTRLTDFERNVMRRVAPFWSWTRHQFPWQIKKFMERPGGPAAKAIRLANLARTGDYVPEWAGTGMAIKIGEDPETGNKSFLSGLDLPHEAILEMISLGGGDEALKKTALSASSLIHPIPKVMAEYITDKSFFRKGRRLSDLDPPLGRAISNVAGAFGAKVDPRFIRSQVPLGGLIEAGAMATPLGRAITTVRKASDPRKSREEILMNLLSGFRTTTVGKKAEAYEIIDRIQAKKRGRPGIAEFSNLYIKDKEAILPDDFQMLRLMGQIQNRLRKEAREEKKKKK